MNESSKPQIVLDLEAAMRLEEIKAAGVEAIWAALQDDEGEPCES